MARLPVALLIVALAACHSKPEIVMGQHVPKRCKKDKAGNDEECVGFWFDIFMRLFSMRNYDDPAIERYVASVGQRLARAANDHRPWKFVVLDDPSVQAFVTLGSTVYINRGTLAALRDEAELAAVLAHEMGHLRGGHAREMWADMGRDVVRSQLEKGLQNLYRRDDEIQADEHAVLLIERAGYRPRAVASMLTALGGTAYDGVSDQNPDDVHPWWPERIARAQGLLASRPDRGELGAERYRERVKSLIVGEDPRRVAVVGNAAVFATSKLAVDLPGPAKLVGDEIEVELPAAKAKLFLTTAEMVALWDDDQSATVAVESEKIGDQALVIIVRGTDAPARAKSLHVALRAPRPAEVATLIPARVDLDAPRRLWSVQVASSQVK